MVDLFGGIDYSVSKRLYDNYDYTQLSFAGFFANVQQSYVVGTMAYAADKTLPTTKLGWKVLAPTAPLPLAYQLVGAKSGPAFEGKDILLYASQACTVSFGSPTALAVSIPATTFMHFHQRCFVLYATQAAGTLDIWIEG